VRDETRYPLYGFSDQLLLPSWIKCKPSQSMPSAQFSCFRTMCLPKPRHDLLLDLLYHVFGGSFGSPYTDLIYTDGEWEVKQRTWLLSNRASCLFSNAEAIHHKTKFLIRKVESSLWFLE
jgi:hypothetical protein